MAETQQHIPMWFFRSDSNIVKDEHALGLRDIYSGFYDWKRFVETAKNNRLTVTCFICNNEATFSTSITGSYPLCNKCMGTY